MWDLDVHENPGTVSRAKGLCFVTSQFSCCEFGRWRGEGPKSLPLLFVCQLCLCLAQVLTLIPRRKGGFCPETLRRWSCFPAAWERSPQEGWAGRCAPVCSILCELALTWLSALGVFSVGVPWSLLVSWRQGSFWIHSLQYKSLKTKHCVT